MKGKGYSLVFYDHRVIVDENLQGIRLDEFVEFLNEVYLGFDYRINDFDSLGLIVRSKFSGFRWN